MAKNYIFCNAHILRKYWMMWCIFHHYHQIFFYRIQLNFMFLILKKLTCIVGCFDNWKLKSWYWSFQWGQFFERIDLKKKVLSRTKSREIVRNCLEICWSEKDENKLAVPLKKIQNRVAKYTCVSLSGIKRIKIELKNSVT